MRAHWAYFAAIALAACSDSAGKKGTPDAGADADAGNPLDQGAALTVDVPASGRVLVKLDPLSIVTVPDPKTSTGWDLAFEGWDVFTNSGISGPGQCKSFGPLDPLSFFDTAIPDTPFLYTDVAGGAFYRWYAYDGPSHALWSRWHVYGIRDGARTWKLQVVSYYGQSMGAPVSALYKVRYADVTNGVGATIVTTDIDASAGGPATPPDATSACLDLGTQQVTMLTPAQAAVSSAWHLCFRRDKIDVNGELGGPRNVGAVDLDWQKTPTETVGDVKPLTEQSTQARFDSITLASFDGQVFRGDRVISAYTDLWLDRTKTPIVPRDAVFLSYAADGKKAYLVGFAKFEGQTAQSPGKVFVRVKGVQ
jgi:hypothetical protein